MTNLSIFSNLQYFNKTLEYCFLIIYTQINFSTTMLSLKNSTYYILLVLYVRLEANKFFSVNKNKHSTIPPLNYKEYSKNCNAISITKSSTERKP